MGNKPLPLVVSDAGPLIHLAQIHKLLLLKKLFNRVVITPKVQREIVDVGLKYGYDDAMLVKKAIDEDWIFIKDITKAAVSTVQRLVEGENISQSDAETLLVAKEIKAELVLIDEKVLSTLAKMYGFEVWNTWTILLEALRKGFLELSDIESTIDELGERRHKLNAEQAAELLEAAKLIDSLR